jgi:hypothetical protein
MFTGTSPLVPPTVKTKHDFNILQSWGNLSPYYSVYSHGLPESSSLIPEGCELTELHWLQRHGARYPTLRADGPAGIAARLKAAKGWKGEDDLEFLNGWTYKLGAEVLTPFGRQQLCESRDCYHSEREQLEGHLSRDGRKRRKLIIVNLGVSARVKYGFLLDKMKGRLPVFRTESQE